MSTHSKLNANMDDCTPAPLAPGVKVAKGGVLIHVGEVEDFYVSCSPDATYNVVHKAAYGAVVKVTYPKGTVEALVVKWCKRVVYTPDRSFVASDLVDDRVRAPKLYAITVNEFHGSVVEVSLREFIEGRTAYDAWSSLDQNARHNVMCQVAHIAGEIHQVRSQFFGSITGSPIMSADPSEYMCRMIIRSKLLNHVNRNWHMGEACTSEDRPVLCHNSLSPDHIILNGDKVVGVVGWGRADFSPLVLEKQWYTFYQCDPQWYEWYCHLSSSINAKDKPRGAFSELCIRFVYELTWNNWDIRFRPRLSEIEKALHTCALWLGTGDSSDATSHTSPYRPRHSDALRPASRATTQGTVSAFDFDLATELDSDAATTVQQDTGFQDG